MATLHSVSSPLRGRLTALPVEPLRFSDAQAFIAAGGAAQRVERFAVGGGMSLYLDELGAHGSIRQRLCARALDSRGPLFNDPREVLEEELRQPGVYFSLLEELAAGERSAADLAVAIQVRAADLTAYLKALREMRIIDRVEAVAGRATVRFRIADGFMRFWFRFVFPFQDDLKAGVAPEAHYDSEIAPVLGEHVAPVFETLCCEWTRRQLGVSRVGSWWGNALDELRSSRERSVEEVDVVGVQRSAVKVLGECKWTTGRLTAKVLDDVETYKLPAMRQAGIKVAARPLVVLFSRSGFKKNLVELAARRADVRLVTVDEVVGDLLGR